MDTRLVEFKPFPWITTNAFYLSADRSRIIKVHLPKKRQFNFYKYWALRLVGFPTPYEFRPEAERCAHEREVYRYWLASGFRVPRLIDDPSICLPGPTAHCIVLEYIDGVDLRSLLGETGVDPDRKLALIAKLFAECSDRHFRVFANKERKLIKYDGNLRNVIVRGDELFHVDFEAGRIAESLSRGAARELARYATEAIRTAGTEYASTIAACLTREYRHTHVIDRIIRDGATKRPDAQGKFSARELVDLLTNSEPATH